jgi:hypothetical protein
MVEDDLRERGIEPGDHEPDPWGLGGPRPDYLPAGEGGQIACEVKQFGKESKLERRLCQAVGRCDPRRRRVRPIRNQVKEAAKQLKPLAVRGIPFIVVLANPEEPESISVIETLSQDAVPLPEGVVLWRARSPVAPQR